MFGWLGKREAKAEPIDEGLWESATLPYLFMRGMPAADGERLRALAAQFLARKHFSGTHGLDITPFMRVQVAAQASILVLELGIEWYDGWSEVIVYPGQFAPEREVVDEAERVAGYNVVIHEFAHKLDMLNGDPNGCPPLHAGMALADWRRAFRDAFDDFCRRVDEADACAEDDGGRALEALPIDPYGSESPGEFFAVASEAFFETPERLEPAYPAIYGQLGRFYRQDPLARLASAGG